ncbi:MAG: hypothetical protein PVF90_05890 [Gemmatimonadota bacterium]
MSKLRTKLFAAVLAITAIGCGGDDGPTGVNSGDALTEAELQVVFSAITNAFEYIGAAPAAVGPAQATQSASQSFDASAPCGSGGTIGVKGNGSGTYNDVTGEFDLSFSLRMTPNGCEVPTETTTITLDGAPYIQLNMDFDSSETAISISGSQTGGIAFTSEDGRSGSCAFDVDFSANINPNSGSGSSSVSGTVCGVTASNLTVIELGD